MFRTRGVAHLPKVGQRSLRGARASLSLAELVGEGDEELAVAPALERGQREDAREVVVVLGALLLGKVTNLWWKG